MIIVKTKLKNKPEKCSKCPFKIDCGSMINPAYMCGITKHELEYSGNWNQPIKPRKKCPLVEVKDIIEL
jgi:hypothetical protein